MSITSLREAVTNAGGAPVTFAQTTLWRELVTAWGGTPTQFSTTGLLREAIAAVGSTPTQFAYVPLLRELVTALGGGSPTTRDPDTLEAQVASLAGTASFLVPVAGTNMSVASLGSGSYRVAKTGGGAVWNASARTPVLSGAFVLKFIGGTTAEGFVGIADNTSLGAPPYNDIDYALYNQSGAISWFENGASGFLGVQSANCWLIRDGSGNLKYVKNVATYAAAAAAAGDRTASGFSADVFCHAAIYSPDSSYLDFAFGPPSAFA